MTTQIDSKIADDGIFKFQIMGLYDELEEFMDEMRNDYPDNFFSKLCISEVEDELWNTPSEFPIEDDRLFVLDIWL